MSQNSNLMEKIVSLSKQRGFIFPGSEIYDGLAGTYDYGPLGTLLKENIKTAWRRSMSHGDHDIVELDSAIFMHPRTWEASGHVGGFSDPLVECKECNTRSRADKMLEDIGVAADEKMSEEELNAIFDEHRDKLPCPNCGQKKFAKAYKFNLLVQSNLGDFTGSIKDPVYLRPETAQGIYVNYKNVQQSMRKKIPFGIAQVGKAFRNEIKPRRFVFRLREFEQMEMQYFVHPDSAMDEYAAWKEKRMSYYTDVLGINPDHVQWHQHENLVFYAKDAWDIEYKFDFGWDEVEGIHARSDYDLSQHQQFSGDDLSYTDPKTNEKYVPHVVETSAGLDRAVFMVIHEFYEEQQLDGGDTRTVLHFPSHLAPYKVAVSPLLKNKEQLVAGAKEIYAELKNAFGYVMWDDHGNIGKRYRRQDEIGTPYCVVFDFDSLEDQAVTVRDRDSMEQERIAIAELTNYLTEKFA